MSQEANTSGSHGLINSYQQYVWVLINRCTTGTNLETTLHSALAVFLRIHGLYPGYENIIRLQEILLEELDKLSYRIRLYSQYCNKTPIFTACLLWVCLCLCASLSLSLSLLSILPCLCLSVCRLVFACRPLLMSTTSGVDGSNNSRVATSGRRPTSGYGVSMTQRRARNKNEGSFLLFPHLLSM